VSDRFIYEETAEVDRARWALLVVLCEASTESEVEQNGRQREARMKNRSREFTYERAVILEERHGRTHHSKIHPNAS